MVIDQEQYLADHPRPAVKSGNSRPPGNKVHHQGLGVDLEIKPITQRMLERYFEVQRELGNDPGKSLPEYYGFVVRGAIAAGFFNGDIGTVDDMRPAAVKLIGEAVANRITESLEISPE